MSQQAFQLTFWMILFFWFFSSPCGSAYLSYQLPANLSWAFCHYKSVIRSKSDIDESPATWSQEPKSMLTFCFRWRTKKKKTLCFHYPNLQSVTTYSWFVFHSVFSTQDVFLLYKITIKIEKKETKETQVHCCGKLS